jgi:putative ABC transport system permease protein
MRALVIAPVPTPNSERLVMMSETSPREPDDPDFDRLAPANLLDWMHETRTLEQVAGFAWWDVNITGIDEPERVTGFRVTPEFFRTLGERPALGRAFTAEEGRDGKTDRVILSHPLWKRRFGGDSAIIGRTVQLNGVTHTIVGVMGEDFIFPPGSELWKPLALDAVASDRDGRWIGAIARLKPTATLDQARAEARTIARQLEQQYPDMNAKWGMRVEPAQVFYGRHPRPYLIVMLASVAFVLLIGCANVANLLLARASTRGREMAVRVALGATRRDLMWQMLAESLVIALVGGAFGVLLSLWGVRIMRGALPAELVRFNPGWTRIAVNGSALAFTVLVSLATAVFVGLIPAFMASRADPQQALKESARTSSGIADRQRLRSALVVGEIALALMLLFGTGLMVRSFISLFGGNQGYATDRALTMQITLPVARYKTDSNLVAFYSSLLDRVRELPGVRAAAVTSSPPSSWDDNSTRFILDGEGKPQRGDPAHQERLRVVSEDYFTTLGAPITKGRDFDRHDDITSPPVVLVSEAFAKRYWPGQDPIGKRLSALATTMVWSTVVGVVGDMRHNPNTGRAPLAPVVYVPATQGAWSTMTLVVRTGGDPAAIAADAQRVIGTIDPALAAGNVATLDRLLTTSLAPQQITAGMLSVFAAMALVLAVIGIYGVVSYSVTQRTHEIGIRMALGAQERDVVRRVLRQGLGLALVGIALGSVGAFAMSKAMRTLLYDVSTTDPLTFIAVAGTLAAVALLGSWIPARRAAAVDPVVALRDS